MKIRNIAIIAHVDHGKTTLVDQLIKKSHTVRENENINERAMDSDDIERERGITILSKNTSIIYNDYKINILDTPGHADFGGEVERIMKMVEGVVLVVDAYEGTMPQTRFVLQKALQEKIIPIVIINKVDRPITRIKEVIDEVYELFIDLGGDDTQIDFPILFTSALKGTSSYSEKLSTQEESFAPIFETIIKAIPNPIGDKNKPLLFQPSLIDYSDHLGRMGVGKVLDGSIRVSSNVTCARLDGSNKRFRVQKLFTYVGLKKKEVEEVFAGDICAIAGLGDIHVGESICDNDNIKRLPIIEVEKPTLKMKFAINTSPLSGTEGKHVTANKIEERLEKEGQKDVSLNVEKVIGEDAWIVSGRGELHLSILIENMRREGYEMQISKPEVILKKENGVIKEPYEDVKIEVPDEYVGSVIDFMGQRGAQLEDMTSTNNIAKLSYVTSSSSLIGFTTTFLTITRGYGIIHHTFKEYKKRKDENKFNRRSGVLIANEPGKASAYGIGKIEDRGILFIAPGKTVYEGMIVGENATENDLIVNVVKGKNLTNVRSAGKDNTVVLKKPRQLSLEACLDYIDYDELVEVTPQNFRMRKKLLKEHQRKNKNKN